MRLPSGISDAVRLRTAQHIDQRAKLREIVARVGVGLYPGDLKGCDYELSSRTSRGPTLCRGVPELPLKAVESPA